MLQKSRKITFILAIISAQQYATRLQRVAKYD
jgi:uncharacterized protein YdeI (YjbR/CyaY-like superfamily)